MITAKCTRCGAIADGTSLEDARSKINHAPGLSRGIPCGDNFNQAFEIISETPSEEKTISVKTDEGSYKKVEGKTGKRVKLDESKPTTE